MKTVIPVLRKLIHDNWVVLPCWLLVAWVMLRIQTYVSGQDPYIYISLARKLVRSGFSSSELMSIAGFIAPGYPLLLAGSIAMFGPFAPYWTNFVLMLGLVLVWVLIIRSIFGKGRIEAVVTIAFLFFVLRAYVLNAHYLLYPFRGTPTLLFVFLGMLAVHRAGVLNRKLLTLAGGISFVAAAAFREPAVIAMTGLIAWLLCRPFKWKDRGLHVGLFLLPGIVVGLVAVVFMLTGGDGANFQVKLWLSKVFGQSEGEAGALFRKNVYMMLNFFRDSFRMGFSNRLWSYVGGALLLAGIVRGARRLETWLFFVLPAAMFFVFYALYVAHWRYFLTVFVFVAPLMASGLEWCIRGVGNLMQRRLRVPGVAAHAVCCVVLTVILGHSISKSAPWGPKFPLAEARRFQAALDKSSLPADRIIIDHRCNYLVDALVCLADTSPADAGDLQAMWEEDGRAFFAMPLSDECFSSSGRYKGATAEQILRHRADLRELACEDGAPLQWKLADALYGLYEVVPWTNTITRQAVDLLPDEDSVLWLDLRGSELNEAEVSVVETESGERLAVARSERPGIMGLLIDGKKVTRSEGILIVAADSPIPADLSPVVVRASDMRAFPAASERSLSIAQWFRDPFEKGRTKDKYAAVFIRGGVLSVPVPAGSGGRVLRVGIGMDAREPLGREVTMTYGLPDGRREEKSVILQRQMVTHEVEMKILPGQKRAEIVLAVEPPDCHGTHFRVHSVLVGCEREP
jgi:hypothetical protein